MQLCRGARVAEALEEPADEFAVHPAHEVRRDVCRGAKRAVTQPHGAVGVG